MILGPIIMASIGDIIGAITMVGSTMVTCGMTHGSIPTSMDTTPDGTMVTTMAITPTMEQSLQVGQEDHEPIPMIARRRWHLLVAILSRAPHRAVAHRQPHAQGRPPHPLARVVVSAHHLFAS